MTSFISGKVPLWGDQQHSYSFKVFIVFVALGLPFPQVHLSVGGGGGKRLPVEVANTSCGITTGPASLHNTLAHGTVTNRGQ